MESVKRGGPSGAQHSGSRQLIIDAHQHFWRIARGDYTWLTPANAGLYRDFLPTDLTPELVRNDVQSTVLIQAAASEEETESLIDLAQVHPFIAGVVGWVDFESPDVGSRMVALVAKSGGTLKGFRPMIQDISEPNWLLLPQIDAAFESMIDSDLVFDALVGPSQLEALRLRLVRYPKLCAVLDHAGKPDIANGEFNAWAKDLTSLARDTGAYCKLSGLLTQAGAHPSEVAIAPYIEHIFDSFGPSRVIWGSDWPVVTTSGSYSQWLALSRSLVERYATGCEREVFGATAKRAYRLEDA